jgi:KDO2-lipid IV(A) lauroyltransferase
MFILDRILPAVAIFGLWLSRRLLEPLVARRLRTVFSSSEQHTVQHIARAFRDTPRRALACYRASLRHHARFMVDYRWVAHAGPARLRQAVASVRGEQMHHLHALSASRRPVIVLTIHMGSMYLGFMHLASLIRDGRRLSVIKLQAESDYERNAYARLAADAGNVNIIRFDGDAGRQAYLELRRGNIVVLTGDVEASVQERVPVRMFGQTCHLQSGPARLALTTGAVIAPVINYWDRDGRMAIRAETPIESKKLPGETNDEAVRRIAQEIATQMERWIREKPHQLHGWHHLVHTLGAPPDETFRLKTQETVKSAAPADEEKTDETDLTI